MKYHQGRLIDHLHLHSSNLKNSEFFYRAILKTLGREESFGSTDECFYCDELFFDQSSSPSARVHLAFQAISVDAVVNFYKAGIAAGGTDNGAPGYRDYQKNYYSAFLLDPDGHNIEAVCDVGSVRSSESVVVTRATDSSKS